LKPGTRLTATVTTTNTPVTERTTTVGSGKVWFVQGNTVILTLPNNENRMYKVQDSYRFNINGQKASVHDLRKGMTVSAEKIVESPKTEMASNMAVTGHAPPPPAEPKPVVAENTAPAQEEAAPAPAPAPAHAEVAETKMPAKLPKTGSQLPLAGVLGLLFTGASFCARKLRLN
jgi:LPXTG-motif cell wall-anchored protein